MFRGVAKLNLDAKGRMAIPAKYRDRLFESCEGRLVMTVEKDPCLLIFPTPEWDLVERNLMKLPNLNRKARSLQRLYIGHATDLELDAQGRILVPNALREFAGISKKAVLIGQGNKFELWDEEAWNAGTEDWLSEIRGDEGESPSEALDNFSL